MSRKDMKNVRMAVEKKIGKWKGNKSVNKQKRERIFLHKCYISTDVTLLLYVRHPA